MHVHGTATIFSSDADVNRILDDAEVLRPAIDGIDDGDPAENEHSDGDTARDDDSSGPHSSENTRHHGDLEVTGGARLKEGKQFYNIVAVIGGPMPSESAKFAGSCPSVAAKKAARKIWDKTRVRKVTLIMRRVSQLVAGRTLYKYETEMVKMKEPVGFFSALVPKFKTTKGVNQTDQKKRIKIVRSSNAPVFGYVDSDGNVITASKDASGEGTLHRSPENNTLVYNIGSRKMPSKVGSLPVDITEWHATGKRLTPSDAELKKYDVAGVHKASVKAAEAAAKAKRREKERALREKARAAASPKQRKASKKRGG